MTSTQDAQDAAAREDWAYSLGIQAGIFGTPLLMVERERKIRLSITNPDGDSVVAPVNQIGKARELADPSYDMPYTPNCDTVYAGILIELQDQPLVLRVPTITDRYFSVEIADAYLSNLPYIGTRTTNGQGGDYVFIPRGWEGELPDGLIPYHVPQNSVMVAIRISPYDIDGNYDVSAVNDYQDMFFTTGLSDWDGGPSDIPAPTPEGMTLESRPNYDGQDLPTLRTIVDLMGNYPPLREFDQQDEPKLMTDHQAMVKSFETVGIVVGQPLNPAELDDAFLVGLKRAEWSTPSIIDWKVKFRGEQSSTHWNIDLQGGSYGNDYLARAEGAVQGLFVHDPHEALYFMTYMDGDGVWLDASKKYTLHFEPDRMPKSHELGFWSVTMYNSEYRLVDNELDRYSVNSQAGLKHNDDGSLTILIQHEKPDDSEAGEWLPSASEGIFRLNMRVYLPTEEVLETPIRFLPPIMPN